MRKQSPLWKPDLMNVPPMLKCITGGVVYMIGSGNYKSAINRLETALMLDYEGHKVLFDFFPNLPTQKALYRIIDQFRKDKD